MMWKRVFTWVMVLVSVIMWTMLIWNVQKQMKRSLPSLPVPAHVKPLLGGTAKVGEGIRTYALTSTSPITRNQYGHMTLMDMTKLPSASFNMYFEMQVDDVLWKDSFLHAILWIGFHADADKESSMSTVAFDDLGMRLFVSKLETANQKSTVDLYRNYIGVLNPNSFDKWDISKNIIYFPKAQWIPVECTIDLAEHIFRVKFDEDVYSMYIPPDRMKQAHGKSLYMGAKTASGTGISVRNVELMKHGAEAIVF